MLENKDEFYYGLLNLFKFLNFDLAEEVAELLYLHELDEFKLQAAVRVVNECIEKSNVTEDMDLIRQREQQQKEQEKLVPKQPTVDPNVITDSDLANIQKLVDITTKD